MSNRGWSLPNHCETHGLHFVSRCPWCVLEEIEFEAALAEAAELNEQAGFSGQPELAGAAPSMSPDIWDD